MLERTCRRIALAISPEQTLIVVTKTHQSFYEPVLAEVPPRRVVAQPRDRGTGAAVLYALLGSLNVVPTASVAIFPSDHYVTDDAAFIRHLDLAFDGVRARPDLLVLLGITPDGPEVDYCWIEMGKRIAEYFQLFEIKRFWQRPSPELATSLWRSGCLWDSSIIVGRISTVLELLMRTLPELCASFARVKTQIGSISEAQAVEDVYAAIPSVDLSQDVLSACRELLTVLPVTGVRWCNLAEPGRLIALLHSAGDQPRYHRE
jgi:mannose-1-phosphate guanylyltransferase